jgi:hypothetical protein
MTSEAKDKLYQKFRKHAWFEKGRVTSTDGLCTIAAPKTLGKKPHQRRRKTAEKTVTVKKSRQ